MSLESDMEELFGFSKKEVIKKPLPLNLPPKPTTIDQETGLDYDKIANSSDFQRICVMIAKMINPEFFKSVSTRVSQPVMKKQLDNKISEYREVVSELKEVLAKRKARLESIPK